jgi:hypothetical protein
VLSASDRESKERRRSARRCDEEAILLVSKVNRERGREGEREGEEEKGERSRGNIKCFHFSSFFFF